MSGWSFTASGLADASEVVLRLASELRAVLGHEAAGTADISTSATAKGWQVAASGDTEDPNVHQALADDLGKVISAPDAETGHSSFTSAHVNLSNFHTPAPLADDAASALSGPATPGRRAAAK
jgi:hypothetical protein